jgi:hypothetical protein
MFVAPLAVGVYASRLELPYNITEGGVHSCLLSVFGKQEKKKTK